MKKLNTKMIALNAIIAAVYAAFTILLAPISYGSIQMRISEIMIFLAFYNKDYIPGLVLGCLIANIPSGLGAFDMVFGTFATLLAETGQQIFSCFSWRINQWCYCLIRIKVCFRSSIYCISRISLCRWICCISYWCHHFYICPKEWNIYKIYQIIIFDISLIFIKILVRRNRRWVYLISI